MIPDAPLPILRLEHGLQVAVDHPQSLILEIESLIEVGQDVDPHTVLLLQDIDELLLAQRSNC